MSTASRSRIRASIALAGAGSLGTFLSAAARELLLRIIAHNTAWAESAPDDDARWLHPRWGRITIDSVSGTSAGAITACQIVKALFEPGYLAQGHAVDTRHTMGGDWVHGADFLRLQPAGNQPERSGPVESPGWTLLSGARLYDTVHDMLTRPCAPSPLASPLDDSGVVALAITLTDLLGYHEPAEFDADRVMGHPDFGAAPPRETLLFRDAARGVRDMGSRSHGEIRKVFIARDPDDLDAVDRFLTGTRRRRRAQSEVWSTEAAARLASVAVASAALPLALGPVALTDETHPEARRLYMDGGVLNNKPVAPALLMARWHDAYRLLRQAPAEGQPFDPTVIREELHYERVCFFLDAFPERSVDAWRSRHPDAFTQAWNAVLGVEDDAAGREERLQRALSTPAAGIGIFLESILTTLRAQDMKLIAKNNGRLQVRDALIDQWCAKVQSAGAPLALDRVDAAFAWAAVDARPAAAGLSPEIVCEIAARLLEVERISGLDGRRQVTMVPIFAPRGLRKVFAGEALHALGGLLGFDARRYDAGVGLQVAQLVLDSLGEPAAPRPWPPLPLAPDLARPDDASPLVERMRVAAKALIDGNRSTPAVIRFFARLPLNLDPVLALFRARLDRAVRGDQDR